VIHALMPKPAPDVEHQRVEDPYSTWPVEEPLPSVFVPTSRIPDRLSAIGPDLWHAGPKRLVRCSRGHGRWPRMRSWLAGTGLATVLLLGSLTTARSQPPTVPAIPPDAQPAPPAEIEQSPPANGRSGPGVLGPDVPPGPQNETVEPLSPSARPDTPGGTTSNGVARPRGAVDPGINRQIPAPGVFPMPIIPPPGTPGGNPTVVPK